MSRERKSAVTPILAILVVVTALLGLYVGGYFWLGHRYPNPPGAGIARLFPYVWVQTLYIPAAKIESFVIGCDVQAGCYFAGGHPPLPE